MTNQDLLDYIKQQTQAGTDRKKIKSALHESGWQEDDIKEAFDLVDSPFNKSISSPSFSPASSGKTKKRLAVIISIVIGLLIVGGGLFAYSSNPNFFKSSEEILQEAIIGLNTVKSLEYSGALEAEADSKDFLSADFSGLLDIQNQDNHKGSFFIKIKIEGEEINLEVKIINKIFYVKFGNLSGSRFFIVDPNSITGGQWIKIDIEAVKKYLKEQLEMEEGEYKKWLTEEWTKEEQKISPEQRADLFKITKRLPGEKIDGKSVYHYQFTIDKEKFETLFKETLAEDVTKEDLNYFLEGEIWIGKKDLLPYKISVNFTLDSNAKEISNSKYFYEANFVVLFKNFDQPVQIDTPEKTVPLEEIIGGIISSTRQKSRDVHRKSDLRQITLALEMYYDNHGSYPSLLDKLVPEIFSAVPVDPSTKQFYQYQLKSGGQDYEICANMEDTKTQGCYTSEFHGN